MASSTHFYLNWAKERIDEMDAVLVSLEGRSAQITASARTAAEKIIADLRTRRDAFMSEMQQQAGASEAVWLQAQARLEADWNLFQVDVKKYVEEFGQMQEQRKATFEGAAAAQLKAWRQAADKMQSEAAAFAADRRAAIETAVQQMRAGATAAEAELREGGNSGISILDGIDDSLDGVPHRLRPSEPGSLGSFQAHRHQRLTRAPVPIRVVRTFELPRFAA